MTFNHHSANNNHHIHSSQSKIMNEELVTPDNASKALLQSIFDEALMDVSIDDDGDILIQEEIKCYVFLSENKDRVRLLTLFGIAETATRAQCLECVNAINSEYVMVKAYIASEKTLAMEYDIYLKGGVPKKTIALTVKRFCTIPRRAVNEEYARDVVE